MNPIKTGHTEIDQCVDEIIETLKKHGLCLDRTEIVLTKVNLAIKANTPVFGISNYSSDNSSNTAE